MRRKCFCFVLVTLNRWLLKTRICQSNVILDVTVPQSGYWTMLIAMGCSKILLPWWSSLPQMPLRGWYCAIITHLPGICSAHYSHLPQMLKVTLGCVAVLCHILSYQWCISAICSNFSPQTSFSLSVNSRGESTACGRIQMSLLLRSWPFICFLTYTV